MADRRNYKQSYYRPKPLPFSDLRELLNLKREQREHPSALLRDPLRGDEPSISQPYNSTSKNIPRGRGSYRRRGGGTRFVERDSDSRQTVKSSEPNIKVEFSIETGQRKCIIDSIEKVQISTGSGDRKYTSNDIKFPANTSQGRNEAYHDRGSFRGQRRGRGRYRAQYYYRGQNQRAYPKNQSNPKNDIPINTQAVLEDENWDNDGVQSGLDVNVDNKDHENNAQIKQNAVQPDVDEEEDKKEDVKGEENREYSVKGEGNSEDDVGGEENKKDDVEGEENREYNVKREGNREDVVGGEENKEDDVEGEENREDDVEGEDYILTDEAEWGAECTDIGSIPNDYCDKGGTENKNINQTPGNGKKADKSNEELKEEIKEDKVASKHNTNLLKCEENYEADGRLKDNGCDEGKIKLNGKENIIAGDNGKDLTYINQDDDVNKDISNKIDDNKQKEKAAVSNSQTKETEDNAKVVTGKKISTPSDSNDTSNNPAVRSKNDTPCDNPNAISTHIDREIDQKE